MRRQPLPSKPLFRVLYVEHNDDSREMLRLLLALSRIDVTAVASAESALSLIQEHRFDLYLLDSWLPDTSGFELCRQMREIHPKTPVLFFSGEAFEADKQRGIEAGATAYVCKPDLPKLLGSISRFLPQAASAAA